MGNIKELSAATVSRRSALKIAAGAIALAHNSSALAETPHHLPLTESFSEEEEEAILKEKALRAIQAGKKRVDLSTLNDKGIEGCLSTDTSFHYLGNDCISTTYNQMFDEDGNNYAEEIEVIFLPDDTFPVEMLLASDDPMNINCRSEVASLDAVLAGIDDFEIRERLRGQVQDDMEIEGFGFEAMELDVIADALDGIDTLDAPLYGRKMREMLQLSDRNAFFERRFNELNLPGENPFSGSSDSQGVDLEKLHYLAEMSDRVLSSIGDNNDTAHLPSSAHSKPSIVGTLTRAQFLRSPVDLFRATRLSKSFNTFRLAPSEAMPILDQGDFTGNPVPMNAYSQEQEDTDVEE